jgi:hypothetical protein
MEGFQNSISYSAQRFLASPSNVVELTGHAGCKIALLADGQRSCDAIILYDILIL